MKYLFILFVLFITACSSDGNDNESNNSIFGTWSYIYPATQCVETYTFNPNNTITITSLDEISTGSYTFSSEADSNNRHSLSFTIETDNRQTDCEGSNADDTNFVVDILADFVTDTRMDWHFQTTANVDSITVIKTPDSSIATGLRIFVTEASHHGDFANDPNLTGSNAVQKIDDFCNKDAFRPNTSVYKAIVVDGLNRDAVTDVDWVLLPNTTYYRADGLTSIGTTNLNSIFDVAFGELNSSIVDSAIITGRDAYVVTGITNASDFSTTTANDSCLNFSTSDSTVVPTFGLGSKKTEDAFANANISSNCELRHFYYCVEQP